MYPRCSGAMMADLEFDEFEGDYGLPDYGTDNRFDRARRMVNMAGAVCSVALVLGLGFWGYRLAVRDVAGVPVMRAMAGAMRVAPADPGGDQASNQGLSVNAIAATGTSQPMSDQLTLAPRPIGLQPDDGTGLQNASASASDVIAAGLQITSTATPASLAISDPAPLGDGAGTLTLDASDQAVDPLNADPEGIASSLRPKARPVALTKTTGKPSGKPDHVQTVSAPGPATEVDPATVQVGTRLAQLGAFDTPDLARARFAELRSAYGEMMSGKSIVITNAQSGGRSFFRLRALGFEGDDDARRFCAVLEADEVDCIPVVQR